MSRVGKKPIPVPKDVTITIEGDLVKAKGPKGELEFKTPGKIDVSLDDGVLTVENNLGSGTSAALHGVTRARVANIVEGVSSGFSKTLEIVGTGWKAVQAGADVEVHVGFNHPVIVKMPEGITAEVTERPPKIKISGIRKELVGQVAANIRKIRPPEPFLGKGIKYVGEYIRRKAGKSAG